MGGPYETFLRALHAAATELMLPSAKTDLGRHCFSYAGFLAGEYFGTDEVFAHEAAAPLRAEFDADFDACGGDLVMEESFVQCFLAKHAAQLTAEAQPHYERFLRSCFQVGCTMCQAECLDQQAFRYCALFAGEFYFPGGPPRDALGVVPP